MTALRDSSEEGDGGKEKSEEEEEGEEDKDEDEDARGLGEQARLPFDFLLPLDLETALAACLIITGSWALIASSIASLTEVLRGTWLRLAGPGIVTGEA